MPKRKQKLKSDTIGYWFVLPALLFMSLFIVYPLIYNFVLSFQKVDVMTLMAPQKEWIGFQNYANVMNGTYLWGSMKNTFVFTIGCIAFQFSIGFLLAVLYTQKCKALKPISGLLLISYIIPGTVCSILFKFMFATNGGIVNELFIQLGLITQPIEWLTRPDMAMWSVIIANTWTGIPFNMILLVSGLVNIPLEVYESATIDGANGAQQFFKITVPLLKSSIQTVLVLGFVYTFKCFELIYVMTTGGPVYSTELMSIYSYRRSFMEFNFSEGAAIANILFIILFAVGLLYTKMIGKDEVA